MRLFSLTITLLWCIIHAGNLYSQELDIFGLVNYPWGAQLQSILRSYDQYSVEYSMEVDKTNNISEISITGLFRYAPYDRIEFLSKTKIYTYHEGSLVEMTIIVTEHDMLLESKPRKKKPAKAYESMKQELSNLYKQSPNDTPVFSEAEDGFLMCQWELESTTVTLARLNEIILLQYSMKKMSPETTKALNNRPGYINLPESSHRYLLPFLLRSTTPVSK